MKHPWSSQQFRHGASEAGLPEEDVMASLRIARSIKSKNNDLPVILTLGHLATLTDLPIKYLERIVQKTGEHPYRVFRVKKRNVSGNGAAAPRRYRTICVPEPNLMCLQRWIAQNILNVMSPHYSSYAFAPNGGIIKAAEKHLECKWLLKMDVRHFFESISEKQVYFVFRRFGYGALVSFQLARICTRLSKDGNPTRLEADGKPISRWPMGHLPQGAPSSPMLANFAMHHFDERVTNISKAFGWTYTRYADDLIFSTTGEATRGAGISLSKLVEMALTRVDLYAHRQKTSLVPPGARKVVLGIAVDTDRLRLTKEYKNNVETHLYALTSPSIGPLAHAEERKFASIVGMRRHITGLVAHARRVDGPYGERLRVQLRSVAWP
jgi:RNA-directed DNA polymerase